MVFPVTAAAMKINSKKTRAGGKISGLTHRLAEEQPSALSKKPSDPVFALILKIGVPYQAQELHLNQKTHKYKSEQGEEAVDGFFIVQREGKHRFFMMDEELQQINIMNPVKNISL